MIELIPGLENYLYENPIVIAIEVPIIKLAF
jgi:hypothetical protein